MLQRNRANKSLAAQVRGWTLFVPAWMTNATVLQRGIALGLKTNVIEAPGSAYYQAWYWCSIMPSPDIAFFKANGNCTSHKPPRLSIPLLLQ